MGIEFDCRTCGRRVKAPDELAGKKARCPHCQAVVDVPGGDVYEAEEMPLPPRMELPPTTPLAPLSYSSSAPSSFPGPQPTFDSGQRKPCPFCGEQILAAAVKCRFCGESFDGPGGQGKIFYRVPNRSGLIFALGILSILSCAVLGPFAWLMGPFAWVMGNHDLEMMRAGLMQKDDGLTQAGRIMGMISTLLMLVGCSFFGLVIFFDVARH